MNPAFPAQILENRSLIRLSGADVLAFLHNLLTCDLSNLPAGRWAYGALLSPQGKIQNDIFVIHDGIAVWIDCARSQRGALMQKLTMYRLRAKIEITPDDRHAVAVSASADLPGLSAPDPRARSIGFRAVVDTGALTGGPGYTRARLSLALADSDADIGSNELFPHEANLDLVNGMSFSKGCYVGQEVVSRMQHRGTVRSRILPVTSQGAMPEKGTPITAGETTIGTMLSSEGELGLALLRLDRLKEATQPLLSNNVSIALRKQAE